MCLIVFAYKQHREYPIIIAANRDEFYDRPTAGASFWQDAPQVLAGRDLKEGGTWFGVTTEGRLAAITNYRNPKLLKHNAPSRGLLVSSYLRSFLDPKSYLENIQRNSDRYNGFNLLTGNLSALFYYSNITGSISHVSPGIHGLSNHFLDTPWPKVTRAKMLLEDLLSNKDPLSAESILDLLADNLHPPDEELPDTGVDIEWERMLSPLFISSSHYGTCSSTALLIDIRQRVTFVEKISQISGRKSSSSRFTFNISESKISRSSTNV